MCDRFRKLEVTSRHLHTDRVSLDRCLHLIILASFPIERTAVVRDPLSSPLILFQTKDEVSELCQQVYSALPFALTVKNDSLGRCQ